jgi:hypothetical protein
VILLDDLVGDADESALHGGLVHQLGLEDHARRLPAKKALPGMRARRNDGRAAANI